MSYVIRNCPCFDTHNTQCLDTPTMPITEMVLCQDQTDCLLKRIVEICKDYPKQCEIEGNCIDDRLCSTCFLGGGCELAEEILGMFEIEECE